MNSRSAIVFGLLGAFAAAAAVPAQAAKYTINWYLGHPNLDYFEEAADEFKKAVEARSGGEIEVKIVTLDGDAFTRHGLDPQIASKVRSGEVEMGHSFTDVLAALDPRLMAFDAPYLFRGYRHMEGVIESPLGAELLGGLRAQGMKGLCFTYSGGASGIATLGREIRKPEDLKGLRIGVFGHPVNEAWLTGLGAIPVAIGHELGSVMGKVRSGELDALVITWRNLERIGADKAFKVYSLPGSSYLVSATYINEKFFNSLPAEHRALLEEESLRSARIERAKTIRLNEDAKSKMLGKGLTEIHLARAGREAFLEALRPAYERSIEPLIGKEMLERIREAEDAAEHPLLEPEIATRR